jgi:hypothetical protein
VFIGRDLEENYLGLIQVTLMQLHGDIEKNHEELQSG